MLGLDGLEVLFSEKRFYSFGNVQCTPCKCAHRGVGHPPYGPRMGAPYMVWGMQWNEVNRLTGTHENGIYIQFYLNPLFK